MGSPDFALPSLRALACRGKSQTCPTDVVGVVTQPDRAAGRGRELKPPPVKTLALELGLSVIQPEKLREPGAMEQLRAWSPDLIVVAAFGQILRPEALDLPRFGCINVHASLLPRWRGAAPVNAAILYGDEETGVTIMKMDAGLDTGPILGQRALRIAPDETAASLFDRLSTLGADLLLETLPGYLSGAIVPHPQPEEGVTYAPMLKKEDARLDFNRPGQELARQVRAYHPWPGAFIDWQGAPLKIHRAHTEIVFTYVFQPPGARTVINGLPAVFGGDNTPLVLDEVQPAGKKPMSGKAFLAGARQWET
ncbi:MAG: methionyl-tRNA formyltransferase [Chloroflexota bacterium]